MNPAIRDLQQSELFPGHSPEIATFQPGAPTQWLDGGTVVLDERGMAKEWDASLQAWWESMGNQVGDHFWTAISRLSAGLPEQVSILAASHGTFAEAVIHLSVAPNHSLRIERVRVPGGAVVRLSSVLPQTQDLVSSESQMAGGALSNSMVREIWKRMLHAENQLATLMRRSPGVVFSQRTDFTFRAANDHLEEVTGIPNPEWQRQGELFWRLVHDSDVEFLRQQIRASALTEQPVTSTYRICHAQTGRIAYILEQRQATLSPDGTLLGYEGVWVDVTRQTLAERRLFASAWKETLAVLTLGMAHDFGNMLAGIHALSESFLAQVQPDHPFYEGLGLIKKNALQTSQLVNRMVNLHQGQPGERGYHNLNELMTDLVELARKILPRRIKIVADARPEGLPLHVDTVELRQVVLNLVVNAADAMSKGGTLTLRTSLHTELPLLEHFKGVRPRLPVVCLSVNDTGCGIRKGHLEAIFDPFFTTKATHKGSGLGLYNASLFAEKHLGCISVSSTENVGSTFQLWLPQADFMEQERDQNASAATAQRRRSLLLAGRAPELLASASELLRLHGYYVATADTPEIASDLLRSPQYQFDAVVIHAESNDATFNSIAAEVLQRAKTGLKLVVRPAGCDQDALNPFLRSNCDLLLSADIPEADFLSRLHQLMVHSTPTA